MFCGRAIVSTSTQDQWAQWLLERRHGGDLERHDSVIDALIPVRDQVLDNANPAQGEVLLDVGTGDGLIAFGALPRLGESGWIILSVVSQDLLGQCRSIAQELSVLHQCQFLEASADDLTAIENESVDVVTTRSVLIFVGAKQKAFQEFYRVLKPGGRLSMFEPINRFGYPVPRTCLVFMKVTMSHQSWRSHERSKMSMAGFNLRVIPCWTSTSVFCWLLQRKPTLRKSTSMSSLKSGPSALNVGRSLKTAPGIPRSHT